MYIQYLPSKFSYLTRPFWKCKRIAIAHKHACKSQVLYNETWEKGMAWPYIVNNSPVLTSCFLRKHWWSLHWSCVCPWAHGLSITNSKSLSRITWTWRHSFHWMWLHLDILWPTSDPAGSVCMKDVTPRPEHNRKVNDFTWATPTRMPPYSCSSEAFKTP